MTAALDPQRWGAATSDAALDHLRRSELPAGWLLDDDGHMHVALATVAFAPVFPCGPHKRPAIPKCRRCDTARHAPGSDEYIACARSGNPGHGFYDAITDPDRIRAWWSRHPEHLVGIPTQGLVVIDLDEPEQPTGASWAWWDRTARAHDHDPTAPPTVTTPSGGVHLYFAAPDGTSVRNSAKKLAPDVDVRADGGYVIAPGSRLPDGRRYELLCPFPQQLPDAPAWLVGLCTREATPPIRSAPPSPTGQTGTRYGIGALEAELGRLAVAGEGTRNDTLVRAAYRVGQLVAGEQIDGHHAFGQTLAVALRIGLPEREAEATIVSGMRSGARAPRQAT